MLLFYKNENLLSRFCPDSVPFRSFKIPINRCICVCYNHFWKMGGLIWEPAKLTKSFVCLRLEFVLWEIAEKHF